MTIEQFLKQQIKYYKKNIKSQSKDQDERYINYIAGKYHAYQTALLVLKEHKQK